MCISTDICIFRESGWLEIQWQPHQLIHTDESFSTAFCILNRSKNSLRYVKSGYPSKWCQNWHPQHQTRQSRVFMQIVWHLQLCLEHWCCCLLAEGVVLIFWLRLIVVSYFWCQWAWLLIVWCCCCHHHQKRRLREFMQAWHLHTFLTPDVVVHLQKV